ncbi:DEAD/DEAH box helicase family protein [Nonomuraea antimicrobica]
MASIARQLDNVAISYTLSIGKRILGIVEVQQDATPLAETLAATGARIKNDARQRKNSTQEFPAFAYVVDSEHIYFIDARYKESKVRKTQGFHTPAALEEWAEHDPLEPFEALNQLPPTQHLHYYQAGVINAIEDALKGGRRRLSVIMAVGTGKTTTIAQQMYRLASSDVARRILYLTDSRLLLNQAIHAFGALEVEPGVSLNAVVPIFADSPAAIHGATVGRTFVYASTIQSMRAQLAKRATTKAQPIHIDAFDAIISDGVSWPARKSQPSWKKVFEYFDAIEIFFDSTPFLDDDAEEEAFPVYRYGLEQAINDGSLVDSQTAKLRPRANRNYAHVTLGDLGDLGERNPRVFLASASADSHDAESVAISLRRQGVNIIHPAEGEEATDAIELVMSKIKAGDTLVPLLSEASVDAFWSHPEVDSLLERRGIEIIPAVLKPCFLPRALAERTVVDVTRSVDDLMSALNVNSRIDLNILSSEEFEELTSILLRRIHFDVKNKFISSRYGVRSRRRVPRRPRVRRPGFLYSPNQVPPSATELCGDLHRLASIISAHADRPHGLLITNAQITSVASEALADLTRKNVQIRVIDGVRFKSFLLAQPDLVNHYFPATGNR